MRLPTVNGSYTDYPDDRNRAPFCLELVSQAPRYGYTILLDEMVALSASSLCLQVDTGRPVLKLLDLSAVLDMPKIQFASILNFLAGSTDEEVLSPVEVLRRAAELSGTGPIGTYLVEHQTTMVRLDRFRTAVGLGGPIPILSRPSIHVSLDSDDTVVQRTELDPLLRSVALWWTTFEDRSRQRLFRSQPNPSLGINARAQTRIPLPFSKVTKSFEHTDAFSVQVINRPEKLTVGAGVSLRLEAPMLGSVDYAVEMTNALAGQVIALARAEPVSDSA